MARKNVSAHNDAQFALFVNQIGTMLDGEKEAQFESIVRRLVRVVAGDAKDARAATVHDAVNGLQLPPSRPGAPGRLPVAVRPARCRPGRTSMPSRRRRGIPARGAPT